MQKNRSYTGNISLIYAAAVILTVAFFIILGLPGLQLRSFVSMLAVLAAESAVCGYTVCRLRSAMSNRNPSPVLTGVAWITAAYAGAVLIAAALLDWGLQLQAPAYAAVQLTLLLVSAALLAVTGIYSRNAVAGEQRTDAAASAHIQHQAELKDIRELAGSWRHPGAQWLVELVAGLEEQFRYSDPHSRPDLYDTEEMLTRQISLLHDQVALLLTLRDPGSGWEGAASELADSIAGTLLLRNRELAAFK
ncbi:MULTISPECIES: hypothetical protein [unclassified Paenibacillus]|uniref:hypothetical protein n=1 Tax=unclassified Paenibacillus TaxID=185978 RepID=UPI0024051590|nr:MULTISPECIES: hypothetical protein [unclassified Paenibacillus]MDF9843993.1 membrane protein implicated in regulation of membrane protease activity [Paenibacillus sp. PastF-2]MDF9850598.1 membrane protein implicated in regulation of membrane protease activity [Paenibacillus sp. PastM-2]MDF9857252.1 membrane protein implicated in regulation of membrane protease activity [Paenibacillus sp. PastF-1]MDH6482448.1 membrane protein implicated in regulation of membrane protease activity [Paenibacill